MVFLPFFLIHTFHVRAQQTTLFPPSSQSWQLIGDVGRVPRSALAQLGCPPPTGHEDEIVLLMLNNRAAGIAQPTLTFTGAAVSVQGAVMTGLDESVLTTMDDAGRSEPLTFPVGSINVDTGAACDVQVAFYNNLTPTTKHTLAVTPNGGTIRMALFNATVFAQPVSQSPSTSALSSTSSSSSSTLTQASTSTSTTSASLSSASTPVINNTHTTSTAAIVVPVVLAVLIGLSVAVFFYRRRRRRSNGAKWASDSSDGVILRPYLERGTSAETSALLVTPPLPPEKPFASAYRQDAKPSSSVAATDGPSSVMSVHTSSTTEATEPDAGQLRAIQQAVQRAGFSTQALLESLNRVQGEHVPVAPREDGTGLPPPRYDG